MTIDAKISITTACGAKCDTCPSWKRKPETMSVEDFEIIYRKLSKSPLIGRILINGTGDITAINDWKHYFEVMNRHKTKYTIMTTNAANLTEIPDALDELIISFNGGTPEGYKATTGLDFHEVAGQIRELYPQFGKLKNLEMHCLIWSGNAGTEQAFVEYWRDFPGALRISWKCENQNEEYFGTPRGVDFQRIPCDYLGKIVVEHDGRVSACNHDWEGKSNFGALLTQEVAEVWRSVERERMTTEHIQGTFSGICEKCNYNVRADGKLVYV
jgi:radical SAM protein with 4Fe4S-binding SPASM domain